MEKEFLKDLNKNQRLAAETIKGYVRIIAGAGSGKTKTLIARTANCLAEDEAPESVLLLTFTKKAAGEMKKRICSFDSIKNGENIKAMTFHSFCAEQLRQYAAVVGFDNNFVIHDLEDMRIIIAEISEVYKDAYKKKGYNTKHFPTGKEILNIYGVWRNSLGDLNEIVELNDDIYFGYKEDVKSIISDYVEEKKKKNIMDYDDLLYYFYRLLKDNDKIRKAFDASFKTIMCDEYQDTNIIQDVILDLMSIDYPNLCVVGDDNQSIYRFRCANVDNIIRFDERHPGCKSIVLYENYRSSQEILDLANAVMEHADFGIRKDLHGQFNGGKPCLMCGTTEDGVASWICNDIQRKISQGIDPKEIAVMIRKSALSTKLEVECGRRGIPFTKYGGISFVQLKCIKDILAMCRMTNSLSDELSWKRVLALLPKIAMKKAAAIYEGVLCHGREYLKEASTKYGDSLTGLYEVLCNAGNKVPREMIPILSDYYEGLRNQAIDNKDIDDEKKTEEFISLRKDLKSIETLKELAIDYITVEDMLDDLMLNVPEEKKEGPTISITTIHSAKGLEYDSIYILDALDGIFPGYTNDKEDMDEEMRCLYVAITRAKNSLYICNPQYIHYNGKLNPGILSPHLNHSNVFQTLQIVSRFADSVTA